MPIHKTAVVCTALVIAEKKTDIQVDISLILNDIYQLNECNEYTPEQKIERIIVSIYNEI